MRSPLLLLLVLPLLGACAHPTGRSAASGKISPNLVRTAAQWKPAHDEFGSSFDAKTYAQTPDGVAVSFHLDKKKAPEQWPYVELICTVGHDLRGTRQIRVKYKSSRPLIVKLSQSEFTERGNGTYSHYQYLASAAYTLTTETLEIASFRQPDWTPDSSKGIPLRLEHVDAIYFTPDLDETQGGDATLEIKELELVSE